MFEKKDFLEFCDQLMAIEIGMEHETALIARNINNERAVRFLQKIINDEIRHEGIVKKIKTIIQKEYV